MKSRFMLVAVTAAFLVAAGCRDYPATSDQIEAQQQEQVRSDMARAVGPVAVVNYREKRLLKYLYELRDRMDTTRWFYTRDMSGKLHLVCVGIGFPLPYSTQYTSPQEIERVSLPGGGYTWELVPQSEPNGVYPPDTSRGTWVIAMTRKGPDAQYLETDIEAFSERIPAADETQAIWPSGKPMAAEVIDPPAPPPGGVENLIKKYESRGVGAEAPAQPKK